MKPIFLALLLLWLSCAAAQPSTATSREIGQLFEILESSGCRFQRNGTWHDAAAAKAHLQRKYNYLLKKDLVTTTESFIELAASESSLSGRPYRVQCGQSAPVDSAVWFAKKLAEVRASRTGANNSFKPKPLRGSA